MKANAEIKSGQFKEVEKGKGRNERNYSSTEGNSSEENIFNNSQ